MSELTEALETIRPELMTVTRLFGMAESVWTDPVRYSFTAEERDGSYIISFTDGKDRAENTISVPDDPDPRIRALHRRRAARRLCKQTLYDLCREITGIHPPWGSMTGVRPTHLMLEALAAGYTPEEAVQKLVREFDVMPERAMLLAEIAEE